MTVLFRVDATPQTGLGHFTRCLTLALALQKHHAAVQFLLQPTSPEITEPLRHAHIPYILLPERTSHDASAGDLLYARWLNATWEKDAQDTEDTIRHASLEIDWLIVDHYGLDARWERRLSKRVPKLMVIDDLADRRHACNLLLDQNIGKDGHRYDKLVPNTCEILLGPEYALLREEFLKTRPARRTDYHTPPKILVFLGGVDPDNATAKVLDALDHFTDQEISVDLVLGAANPNATSIKMRCSDQHHIRVFQSINTMADLMAHADLAIGGGGTATWERCMMGLPSISIILAKNQQQVTESVAACGAAINLGWHASLQTEAIVETLRRLLRSPEQAHSMSQAARGLMGGAHYKGADFVAGKIMEFHHAQA